MSAEERARAFIIAACEEDGADIAAATFRQRCEEPGDGGSTVLKAIIAAEVAAYERAAAVADMHDHRGDIGKAILALKDTPK